MINIKQKEDCCGCTACQQICPNHCITMVRDLEGFLYPHIDANKCTNCGLCNKACQEENRFVPCEIPKSFACKSIAPEMVTSSSSGGLFSILASKVVETGGIVYGAKFNDDWTVSHSFTDTLEGIADFKGSKYIQSNLEDTFINIKKDLQKGRTVLFSGTPCQVAGLNHFLRKNTITYILLILYVIVYQARKCGNVI